MGKDAPQRSNGKVVSMRPGIAGKWRDNRGPAIEVNWGEVDATRIRLAIDAVTRAGGAVMFGRTSDAGAYSVCVLMDSDRLKEYPHTSTECEELLQAITEELIDL